MRPFRLALAATGALAAWVAPAAPAAAQAPIVLAVRAVDSTHAPVGAAEVTVLRGLQTVLARGSTSGAGLATLRLAADSGDYEVVVRRLGYARASRFVHAARGDSLRVDVVLQRLPARLDTVRVAAAEDLRRKHLFVDAEAIAASKRPLASAIDVVEKLRPEMVWGLGGKGTFGCRPASFIWVNGTRIRLAPTTADHGLALEQRMNRRAARAAPHMTPSKARTVMPVSVLSVLNTIRPEHIESMRYNDCYDLSVDRASATSALFVVLKPGVGFEAGRGSYVAVEGSQVLAEDDSSAAPAASAPPMSGVRRLLGLFDDDTGAPVEGADVVELATGTRATTSATGTVSLAFLQPGEGRLVLRKAGYRPDTISVVVSPRDTAPLTLILTRQK